MARSVGSVILSRDPTAGPTRDPMARTVTIAYQPYDHQGFDIDKGSDTDQGSMHQPGDNQIRDRPGI
ncbi:hypothetical protein U1Q18_023414 [Sarracenia purpurea var. burkii]